MHITVWQTQCDLEITTKTSLAYDYHYIINWNSRISNIVEIVYLSAIAVSETKKEIFRILSMHIILDFQQKSYELLFFYPGMQISVPKAQHTSIWS